MYRRLILVLVAGSCVTACASSQSHPTSSATSQPSSAAPLAVTSLASPATLTGNFVAAGGPGPGSLPPLSGTITIAGPVTQHLTVGPDGKYTATLPPGTYTVTGTSPQYNDGAATCDTESGAPMTLTAGQSATADVLCQEK